MSTYLHLSISGDAYTKLNFNDSSSDVVLAYIKIYKLLDKLESEHDLVNKLHTIKLIPRRVMWIRTNLHVV